MRKIAMITLYADISRTGGAGHRCLCTFHCDAPMPGITNLYYVFSTNNCKWTDMTRCVLKSVYISRMFSNASGITNLY
jgi:hypothetical protein